MVIRRRDWLVTIDRPFNGRFRQVGLEGAVHRGEAGRGWDGRGLRVDALSNVIYSLERGRHGLNKRMCRVGRGNSQIRREEKEGRKKSEEGVGKSDKVGDNQFRDEAFIIRDDSSMQGYARRARAIIGPVLTPLSSSLVDVSCILIDVLSQDMQNFINSSN